MSATTSDKGGLLDLGTCLDSTCEQVTIMGETSCERGSIVESCNFCAVSYLSPSGNLDRMMILL